MAEEKKSNVKDLNKINPLPVKEDKEDAPNPLADREEMVCVGTDSMGRRVFKAVSKVNK